MSLRGTGGRRSAELQRRRLPRRHLILAVLRSDLPRWNVQRRSTASDPTANRMVEMMVDKNKKAPREALVCLLTGGEGVRRNIIQ